MVLPTTTSEGKCCRLVDRVAETAVAVLANRTLRPRVQQRESWHSVPLTEHLATPEKREGPCKTAPNKETKRQYLLLSGAYMGMFKPNSTCLATHEDQQSRYDLNITFAFPEDDNLFIQRQFPTSLSALPLRFFDQRWELQPFAVFGAS
jgi:hypothetical protein